MPAHTDEIFNDSTIAVVRLNLSPEDYEWLLTYGSILTRFYWRYSDGDCIGDHCQHCSRRSVIVCYSVDSDLQYNLNHTISVRDH
jgi:hypothetical protein